MTVGHEMRGSAIPVGNGSTAMAGTVHSQRYYSLKVNSNGMYSGLILLVEGRP